VPDDGRKEKEKAIRSRFVAKMEKALAGLGKRIVEGKLKDRDKMLSCFKLRIHKWRKFCCHTEAPQFTLAMQKVGVCATSATSQPLRLQNYRIEEGYLLKSRIAFVCACFRMTPDSPAKWNPVAVGTFKLF